MGLLDVPFVELTTNFVADQKKKVVFSLNDNRDQ